MSGHTPGPWSLHRGEFNCPIDKKHDKSIGSIVSDFEGFYVAKVEECESVDGVDEAEANARLIAAAPDLLEALKNIVKVDAETVASYRHSKDPSLWIVDLRKAVTEANAAIAKATGGSNVR